MRQLIALKLLLVLLQNQFVSAFRTEDDLDVPTCPVNIAGSYSSTCDLDELVALHHFDGRRRRVDDFEPIDVILRALLPDLTVYHYLITYALQLGAIDNETLRMAQRMPTILILPDPSVFSSISPLLNHVDSSLIDIWSLRASQLMNEDEMNPDKLKIQEKLQNVVGSHIVGPKIMAPEDIADTPEKLRSRTKGFSLTFKRIPDPKNRAQWRHSRAFQMSLYRNGRYWIEQELHPPSSPNDDGSFLFGFGSGDANEVDLRRYRQSGRGADREIEIHNDIKVTEVIPCGRGFIFLIDGLLTMPDNLKDPAPDMLSYFRDHSSFAYSFQWLTYFIGKDPILEKAFKMLQRVGKVTVFVTPDQYLVLNGYKAEFDLVKQWFDSHEHLKRNVSHSIDTTSILATASRFVIPGIYSSNDLYIRVKKGICSLLTLSGDSLDVAVVDGRLLVDGVGLVQTDVPLFNGVIHILGAIPTNSVSLLIDKVQTQTPDVAWTAVQALCEHSPSMVPRILRYLDRGGVLPRLEGLLGLGSPSPILVPPGPRPSWLCRGYLGWEDPFGGSEKMKEKKGEARHQLQQSLQAARDGHVRLHRFSTGRWRGVFNYYRPSNKVSRPVDVEAALSMAS